LSQVTYIGGKMVAPPTVADFDEQLKAYRLKVEETKKRPPPRETARVKEGFKIVFGYEPLKWPL
jgi:hypothetical protein